MHPSSKWQSLLLPCLLALTSAAPRLAFAAQPVPNAEEGRAVFVLQCARCHGDTAGGGDGGPPLRPGVRSMSEDAFATKVLRRTHWNLPATASTGEGAARDAFVEGVLRMREDDRAMPAWESVPEVANAVRSLHIYLSRPAAP